ncbi:MAG: BatA domain-containing protein [Verrucomicrobiota bacterium]
MSFLFPLYFLGAIALAVPVVLHLRKRPPKEHFPFSSHIFLEQTAERLTRRSQIERWWLLLLRCLALLLLALVFARPFFSSPVLDDGTAVAARGVILLDRSASMKREGVWDAAVRETEELINTWGSNEVAVLAFDEDLQIIGDFESWKKLSSRARVSQFNSWLESPEGGTSWKATHLGAALKQAGELLQSADEEAAARIRQIAIVSDFQEGALRDGLAGVEWQDDVLVTSVSVSPDASLAPGNASLDLATSPLRSEIDQDEVYRVRLTNSQASENATFSIRWRDAPETARDVVVAPGTSRIITSAPKPVGLTDGVIELSGDAHAFDNAVYVSPIQQKPLRISFLGEEESGNEAGTPLFYFQRAMQPTPTLDPLVAVSSSWTAAEMGTADAVVIDSSWSGEGASELGQFVEAGGLVIFVPSSSVESAAVESLLGGDGWNLSEAEVDNYALLSDLDFDHPVLVPFARAGIRDFTGVRFWKYRNLVIPEGERERAEVLAQFDGDEGKSPALVELNRGEGVVFMFLSGWSPDEGQLSLSSKFVPLLFAIFERAGFSIRSAPSRIVGEGDLENPGFHDLDTGERIAVNLAPGEGRCDPFDPQAEWSDLGIPFAEAFTGESSLITPGVAAERVESSERESRQQLWKWVLLVVLILLLFETWLAGASARRRREAAAA